MPGNYANTSNLVDTQQADADDVKVPMDALDDKLHAVVTGVDTISPKADVIALPEQSADPAQITNTFQIFSRDDGKLYAMDGTGNKYDLVAGGGGASNLGDLNDVDLTGASNGDVLSFNGTSWVPEQSGGTAGYYSGDLKLVAYNTPPSGWLLCDGSAVSRTTYAALFAAIGEMYGAGDGSATFNVPDLRGRVAVGAGTGSGLGIRTLGDSFGEEEHQLTVSELANHNHLVTYRKSSGTSNGIGAQGSSGTYSSVNSGNKGNDQPHNNMQPSAVINYIIKT